MSRAVNGRLTTVLVVLYLLVGLWAVKRAEGEAATTWMNIYATSDFPDGPRVLAYLRDLRVPIPPVISLLEIADDNLTGNTAFMTDTAYRAALLIAFLIPLLLSVRSRVALLARFALSTVFLLSTVAIHPGNPQTYDVFYPLFVLLSFLLLDWASRGGWPARARAPLLAGAGFFLALAELTRPFVFLILPYVILCACLLLRSGPRRHLVSFLVPVAMISGAWHAHLLWRHGQIGWSNHTGFNLLQAWGMIDRPALEPESGSAPLAPGRWSNLNTADHAANSRRLTAAVLDYVRRHPLESAVHAADRLKALLVDARTDIFDHRPRQPVLWLYRPLVWTASASLLANLLAFALGLVRGGLDRRRWLAAPEHVLLVLTAFSVLALALGDAGEEARFLITLLPLLAASVRNPWTVRIESADPGP